MKSKVCKISRKLIAYVVLCSLTMTIFSIDTKTANATTTTKSSISVSKTLNNLKTSGKSQDTPQGTCIVGKTAYFTKTDGKNGTTTIYKYSDITSGKEPVKAKNDLKIPDSNDLTYFQGKLYLCSENYIYQVEESNNTYTIVNKYKFSKNSTYGVTGNTNISSIAFYKGKTCTYTAKDNTKKTYYLAYMIMGVKKTSNTISYVVGYIDTREGKSTITATKKFTINNKSGYSTTQGITYMDDQQYLFSVVSDNADSNKKNAILVTELTGLDSSKTQTYTPKSILTLNGSGSMYQLQSVGFTEVGNRAQLYGFVNVSGMSDPVVKLSKSYKLSYTALTYSVDKKIGNTSAAGNTAEGMCIVGSTAYFCKSNTTNSDNVERTRIYTYTNVGTSSAKVSESSEYKIKHSNDITYYNGKFYTASDDGYIYQLTKQSDSSYKVTKTYTMPSGKKAQTITAYKGGYFIVSTANGTSEMSFMLGKFNGSKFESKATFKIKNLSGFKTEQGIAYLSANKTLYFSMSDNSGSGNRNAIMGVKITQTTGLNGQILKPDTYLRLDNPSVDKYEMEGIGFMNTSGKQILYAYVNQAGKSDPFLKTSYSYSE